VPLTASVVAVVVVQVRQATEGDEGVAAVGRFVEEVAAEEQAPGIDLVQHPGRDEP
jgi:hypothetical protein